MKRVEYRIRGVVQGVGFRPHIVRVASHFPITGLCGNDEESVFIEAQGNPEVLDTFMSELLETLPPLAHVVDQESNEIPLIEGEHSFAIVASRHRPGSRTLIPPDTGTCPECEADVADPTNRRYGYAFTTCTNCGPRLSIIQDLPYDRPLTTMKTFPLCSACEAEYTDPTDRRYHAQPISCFDCGPRAWIGTDPAGTGRDKASQDAVFARARELLAEGKFLAVKGLGGFHIMCDATNEEAVARLRERKRRPGKPFAIMTASVEHAGEIVDLGTDSRNLLTSTARPIVIAPMKADCRLAPSVAPGLEDMGIMLPYTPLHTLLLSGPVSTVVATSGNLADEPLCYTNEDAIERLSHIVDEFLMHDRDIEVAVEDSVYLAGSVPIPSRRSRGYAPIPVSLDEDGPVVLGVGGELKNTFTLTRSGMAFVSAHVGDMGSLASQQAFDASVAQMLSSHRVRPDLIVCDMHPGYATTGWASRYAEREDIPLLQVQHHHAHALSLLAEHHLLGEPALIASLDGTGYGTDGAIWGGEILRVGSDPTSFDRLWHVPEFDLAGGDRSVRYPWRTAVSLTRSWGLEPATVFMESIEQFSAEHRVLTSQLSSGMGVARSTSLGRVFDAASALLGLCLHTTYEAQAAMELERLARTYPGQLSIVETPGSMQEIMAHLIAESGTPEKAAWTFHARLALYLTSILDERRGEGMVGVTGGVAMNRLLMTLMAECATFPILTHSVVPPNDGGLSLGQAAVGHLTMTQATYTG